MSERWHATDTLHMKGTSHHLKVKRLYAMGIGNKQKGTEDGVIYWCVETSPQYGTRTGIHSISLVPETRLRPIDTTKLRVR